MVIFRVSCTEDMSANMNNFCWHSLRDLVCPLRRLEILVSVPGWASSHCFLNHPLRLFPWLGRGMNWPMSIWHFRFVLFYRTDRSPTVCVKTMDETCCTLETRGREQGTKHAISYTAPRTSLCKWILKLRLPRICVDCHKLVDHSLLSFRQHLILSFWKGQVIHHYRFVLITFFVHTLNISALSPFGICSSRLLSKCIPHFWSPLFFPSSILQ